MMERQKVTGGDPSDTAGVGEAIVYRMKKRIADRGAAAPPTIDLTQALVAAPPPVSAADIDFSDPAIHKLGLVPGDDDLRQQIAELRHELFDAKIDAENVIVTCGANQAFLLALLGFVRSDEDVVLLSPYFFNHAMAIRAHGARVVPIPCGDPSFQPDFQMIEKLWSDRTAAVVVTDPSNPTGMHLTSDTRNRLGDIVYTRGRRLIIDETYVDFQFSSPAALPRSRLTHTLVIGSFSKSLSLSGWRIGYLIASRETVQPLITIQDAITIAAPTAAQVLTKAALGRKDQHLSHVLPQLRGARDRLRAVLKRCPIIDDVYGESGVFLWARLKTHIPSDVAADYLLDHLGVAVIPGDEFGGAGYIRCAYGKLTTEELDNLEQRLPNAHLGS